MESIGLVLLRAGVVTPADLVHAVRNPDGRPLSQRLAHLGIATETDIARAMQTAKARGGRPRPSLPQWKNGRPVRVC